MTHPDTKTVQTLRSDVALQIARHAQRLDINQISAAKQLRIPQPTLSKIVNGRTSDLSLELLIRIAVRAGLPVTLHTGRIPQEAGAFVSLRPGNASRVFRSRLAEEARESVKASERGLTASERLEAFVEHNQHVAMLKEAGRTAEMARSPAP